MRRAVFLDRDGVLNRTIFRGGESCPPASLEDLEILPGVPDACRTLRAAGFLLIVVTNQPDVSRKTTSKDAVERINDAVNAQVPLDDFRVCYHDNQDACSCRKPMPGLLLQAADDWGVDLKESFMVGDRWKDIEAGRRAGCRTILISEACGQDPRLSADCVSASLLDASNWILNEVPPVQRRTGDASF